MRESFSIRLSWVVAALFALSPLQALAANLTYSRQFYQPPTAGAARIPRTTASGGLHLLDQQSGPGLSNNQTTKIPNDATYASSTTMIDNKPYVLASATVTGGLQGAATVYSPLPAFIPVTVGTSDIAVTYLYLPVPVSGICPPPPQPCGGGGSQVVIDEASDDTGGLLDDEFVHVFVPPGAGAWNVGLSNTANFNGTVDTNQDVQIAADDQPIDASTNKTRTSLIFDRWVGSSLPSPGAAVIQGNGQRNLDVNQGQTGYFLAYYRIFCPTGFHFVASANSSECLPDNCTASQNWDPATNTCVTCAANTLWDPTKNQCEEVASSFKCPELCPNRCYVMPEGALGLNPPPDCPGGVLLVCRNTEGRPIGPAACAPAK